MPFPSKLSEVIKKISKPMKDPVKVLGLTPAMVEKINHTFKKREDTREPKIELRAVVYLLRSDANCSYGFIARWITDNRPDLLDPNRKSIAKTRVFDIWLKALRDREDERVHQYKLPFNKRRKAREKKNRSIRPVDRRIAGMTSRAALDVLLGED